MRNKIEQVAQNPPNHVVAKALEMYMPLLVTAIIFKGGAEPPLPVLRRQAPRWARGWVGDPRARYRTPPAPAPFAKKVGSKT